MPTLPKHFNDMTHDEQQLVLSRMHPSLRENGIWVSPGAPTEEEVKFFRELPGAPQFFRRLSELTVKVVEVGYEQSA